MNKRKKYLLQLCGWMLCIMIFLLQSIPANAEVAKNQKKTIRVGWYQMDGYQEMSEEGKPTGYYYDYLQTVSYYTGWDYEYVQVQWSECMQMLQDGEIDIVCGVNKTEERQQWYDFSVSPIDTEMYSIYVPMDDSDLDYEDFENFNGLRIAVAADSFEAAALHEYAATNHFSYEEVMTSSYDEAEQFVTEGKVDAIVSSSLENHIGYKVVGQYAPDMVYFATTKGNTTVINQIDYAMTQIYAYYSNYETLLNQNNFETQDRQIISYSKKEQEFIDNEDTIIMACGSNWYPYEYYDDVTESFEGISVDIMRQIAEKSGLKIQFISDTGTNMSSFAEGYGNNYITSMSYDSRWADDSNVFQTQPFISSNVTMILGTNMQPETVALLSGGYIYRNVEKYYPDLTVITCDTALECMEAVESGKADCTFLNEYEANYYFGMVKYQDLNQRRVAEFTQNLCFGISDRSDPMLVVVLSKTLNSIGKKNINQIVFDHATPPEDPWYQVLIYEQPVAVVIAAMITVTLILLIVMLLYRAGLERKKRIEVERANEARTAFLSRISHDMRTPMNGIIGLVDLSKGESDIGVLNSNIQKIGESGKYLLNLINDTLDMNRVESNKLILNPKRIYARTLIQNVVQMIEPTAESKKIDFSYDKKNLDIECYVLLDEMRMKQIFVNLLSNAIKFTPEGGSVKLTGECLKKERNLLHCKFEVIDTGIGMSEEYIKNRLYQPFSQENNRMTSEYAGSGLGLAIVKNLVELMGGTIEVSSELGSGTTFSVFLNISKTKDQSTEEKSKEEANLVKLSGKRVLMAEDHPLNTEIACRILEKKGLIVDCVTNGQEAVDKFNASKEFTYDFILMDIRMPVMDGIEAAKEIRSLERGDAKTIPIIAMTANVNAEDRELSKAAGMNAHLAKPIVPQLLFQTIMEQINNSSLG